MKNQNNLKNPNLDNLLAIEEMKERVLHKTADISDHLLFFVHTFHPSVCESCIAKYRKALVNGYNKQEAFELVVKSPNVVKSLDIF